jgi:glycosyltransferase involved in cell wall biosynthesis
MLARIQELCTEGWPDVLVAEDASGGDILAIPDLLPRVLVKYSVGAIDARQIPARSVSARLNRVIGARLVFRHEARAIEESDLVVALTADDAAEMRRLYSPREIVVVPNGVRVADHSLSAPSEPSVGFIGDYSWSPNVDAVRWFLGEIWPSVRAAAPEATFSLIGRNLDSMPDLAGPGIRRLGYIPDLGEALASIAVGVVPVRTGTGIRCKLLDLLAAGIPTVTTRLGLRGVPVQEGVDCFVADAPDEFALHVLTLLRDRQAHSRMARSARELAMTLTWSSRANLMEEQLERLLQDRRGLGNTEIQ